MLPLAAALLPLVSGVASGVVSKFSHNKYANLLEKSTLSMPEVYNEARGIYEKLSATGLPGVDQAKLDLIGGIPSTLSAYKEVADNPASVLGALADAQVGVNKGLTDLSIKDALAKLENNQNLAAYLTREGAVRTQYDQYNNELKMSAAAERMAGTKELLGGISSGISSGISAYGNLTMANSFNDMFTQGSSYSNESASSGSGYSEYSPLVEKIMKGIALYNGSMGVNTTAKKDFTDAIMLGLNN